MVRISGEDLHLWCCYQQLVAIVLNATHLVLPKELCAESAPTSNLHIFNAFNCGVANLKDQQAA